MSEPVERVDIPCGGPALAAFRPFRAWAEQVAASQGKTLDPASQRFRATAAAATLPRTYGMRPAILTIEST